MGGNSPRRIKADFQQTGTHFKTRDLAGHGVHTARQRLTKRAVLAARGGAALLQYLPIERNALAFATLEEAEELCFLLVKVFLRIDPPVDREPAFLRHDIEAGPASALAAEHQNRVASLFCTRREVCCTALHFALQLLKPPDDI